MHTHSLAQTHNKASWEVSPVSMRDKREINFIPFLYKVAHLSLNLQTYIHITSWLASLSIPFIFLFTLLPHVHLTLHISHYISTVFSLILLLQFICSSRSKKNLFSLFTLLSSSFCPYCISPPFFSFLGPIQSLLLL